MTGRYKDAKNKSYERDVIPSQFLLNSEDEENEERNNEKSEVRECSSLTKVNSPSSSETPQQRAPSLLDPSNLLAICKRIYCSFCGYLKSSWKEKFTLLVMAAFALWALAHAQTGDSVSSLDRLVILWQGFLQRVKLFTRNP